MIEGGNASTCTIFVFTWESEGSLNFCLHVTDVMTCFQDARGKSKVYVKKEKDRGNMCNDGNSDVAQKKRYGKKEQTKEERRAGVFVAEEANIVSQLAAGE